MGREKSTELFSFQAKKCPCSLFLAESSDCCKDEHEVLSIDDSQTLSHSLAPQSPDFFFVGLIFNKIEIPIIGKSHTQLFIVDFLPPPKEPIYQLNCSLVLYDNELSA